MARGKENQRVLLTDERETGLSATVVGIHPHSRDAGLMYEVRTSSRVGFRRTLYLLTRQVGKKPPKVGEKVRLTWIDERRNSRWEVSPSSRSGT